MFTAQLLRTKPRLMFFQYPNVLFFAEMAPLPRLARPLENRIIHIVLILLHQAVKFSLRINQRWLAESATPYTRTHLLELYDDGIVDTQDDDSGRAVSIIGAEVEKLGGFVGKALSQACADIAMPLGVTMYMLIIKPFIAMFALAVLLPKIILMSNVTQD